MIDVPYLCQVAQELVVRVRDDEPEANGRWLENVTTSDERWALLFILASAIPDDMTWTELTEWAAQRLDGGVDTPHKIARRRVELNEALHPRAA